MLKAIIFDWGDTVMRDFPEKEGPMAYWDKVELIYGIEEALIKLSKEYICCIATNAGASDTSLMIKALERVGVERYFSHYFSSKDFKVEKPDKRFFSFIAERIHINPEECISVGNIYEKDIVPAKATGMKTIFFNEYILPGEYSEADFIINHMNELYYAIKKHI